MAKDPALDDDAAPDLGTSHSQLVTRAAPRLVVGIGASAGGLEALEAFFRVCSRSSGFAFIVVQHLSPDHKSHMVELLSKHTRMTVRAAQDGTLLCADHVYLLPPKKVLVVTDGRIRLTERDAGPSLPVDMLFASLAEEFGELAVGTVLSGTGSDGLRGARELKEAGGLVLVQDPDTAKFDGMPRAIISAGLADHIVRVEDMPRVLTRFVDHAERARSASNLDDQASDSPLVQLLMLLRRHCGVDFSKYKASTVQRRIQRRMALIQASSVNDYLQVVRESPAELNHLFRELLISVTRFFRDTEHFEILAREVIPALLEGTPADEPLRIWVAGCATGEEAYSVAMLMEEQLERTVQTRDFKVFATDIDRDALDFAGAGVYPESIVADVGAERLQKFFVRKHDGYQVARFLRQRVVFANHDVTRDPPFSKVSLVSCRNLLIYFAAPLQAQVLASLRFALRPNGFLFLGTSETPGDLGDDLRPFNANAKIFRRTGARSLMTGLSLTERAQFVRDGVSDRQRHAHGREDAHIRDAHELLGRCYVPPTVLVNTQHDVVHLFGDSHAMLRLPVGGATLNLLQLVPKTTASVLSLALHRALRDEAEVCYHGVAHDDGILTVIVRPLPTSKGTAKMALVTLQPEQPVAQDNGPIGNVSADAQRQILDLQQELTYSRENLQATIEEMETSNEELQATNEELMASNEELQSTNEELQSVNEELHTLNVEYQQKIAELIRLNDDINNFLASSHVGSIFLDAELRITRFTPAAASVIRILDRDVGRPLEHLSFDFPHDILFDAIARLRQTGGTVECEVTDGGSGTYLLRVGPYLSANAGATGYVITIMNVTESKALERKLSTILDALPQHVAVLDRTGCVQLVNAAWRRFALGNGARDDESTCDGANYLDVLARNEQNEPEILGIRKKLEAVLRAESDSFELEYPCHSATEQRWFLMQAQRLDGAGGGAVVSHINITGRKLLELQLAPGRGTH